MALASQSAAIAELRARLERMTGHGGNMAAALPFGVEAIDGQLPGGGLCLGHLHEVIEAGPASEHAAIASIFAAGILARLPGPVLWCLRGRDLFAPALARVGLHPDRVIYCETWKDRDVLPAMEVGLRCKGLAGVVGEATRLSLTTSRRLQLCAGETGVTALLIRRPPCGRQRTRDRTQCRRHTGVVKMPNRELCRHSRLGQVGVPNPGRHWVKQLDWRKATMPQPG
jgi:protein ImuA